MSQKLTEGLWLDAVFRRNILLKTVLPWGSDNKEQSQIREPEITGQTHKVSTSHGDGQEMMESHRKVLGGRKSGDP